MTPPTPPSTSLPPPDIPRRSSKLVLRRLPFQRMENWFYTKKALQHCKASICYFFWLKRKFIFRFSIFCGCYGAIFIPWLIALFHHFLVLFNICYDIAQSFGKLFKILFI